MRFSFRASIDPPMKTVTGEVLEVRRLPPGQYYWVAAVFGSKTLYQLESYQPKKG